MVPSQSDLFRKLGQLRSSFETKIREKQPIIQSDIDELNRLYADLALVRHFTDKDRFLNQANVNFFSSFMFLYQNRFVDSVTQILEYCKNLCQVYLADNSSNLSSQILRLKPYAVHLCERKGTNNYFEITFFDQIESVFDQILATGLDKDIFNEQLFCVLRPVYIDIKNNLRGYNKNQDTIRDNLNDFIIKSKRTHKDNEKHYSTAIVNSIGYKLHKYYLFKLIRDKNYTDVASVCQNMKKCAHEAKSSYATFCRLINNFDTSSLLGTQIDYEYSKYYYNYYCNLNPRKAIEALKNIESKLILSKFESDHERTHQINYFERELNHFVLYFKLILLRSEVDSKKEIMHEAWETGLYDRVSTKLSEAISMFRRNNEIESSDFDLKIISSTFSGIITELFLYRLIIGLKKENIDTTQVTNEKILEFINEINSTEESNINLREDLFTANTKTDADIMFENTSGKACLSIKNRPIGECMDDIKHEFSIFNENNISKVYLLVNLLKTVKDDYDHIKSYLETDYSNITVIIIDIRDFTSNLLTLQSEMQQLMMFNLELYSILDY